MSLTTGKHFQGHSDISGVLRNTGVGPTARPGPPKHRRCVYMRMRRLTLSLLGLACRMHTISSENTSSKRCALLRSMNALHSERVHMAQGSSALAVLTHLPDGQLLASAKAGDDEALEELIRHSWVPCMRVARSLLGNSDDAADALQTAFCRAFTHLNGFRGQAQFSTWVVRIVINQCMMRLRAPYRNRVLSYDQTPGGVERLATEEIHPDNNPEDSLANRQVADVLRFELSCLPPFFRAPLELYYLDGQDLEDVAVQLGITAMAVKSRLHRGRQYLRDRMVRHCGQSGVTTLLTRH